MYKKINSSYINLNQYEVNKQYNIPIDNISGSGVNIYVGEYLPVNNINFFDTVNDDKTTNDEFKRLIFYSIKHLYYHNYFDNNFISNSIYENYLQTTLSSGSFTTNIRKIGNISGSSFQGINSIYNESINYDNNYLYDDVYYNSDNGSKITVLSIDKEKFGNNIKPNTFSIIFNDYYIKDDGEGNIFDYINELNYIDKIQNNQPGEIYIGNIIYSHGIIILTNESYICLLGGPPTAINNYYTHYNLNQQLIFDITSNDYSDCSGINYNSIQLITGSNFFPDCFINNQGFLEIIQNQNSYIPGNHQIEYILFNNNGLQSNNGIINLNILEYPLEIRNFTSSLLCNGVIDSINYSFNIYGGTPEYSYSWDDINYINVNGFYDIIITGSINSENNILYIRDYRNNNISESFNFNYPAIDYNIDITEGSLNSGTGSIDILSINGISYTLNNSMIEYNTNEVYYVPIGNYKASIKDLNLCEKDVYFTVNPQSQITYNIISKSISCNMGNNGSIIINNIQGGSNDSYLINIQSSSFTTSSINNITFNNITAGNYNLEIIDIPTNYTISSSITITQPEPIILSLTSSYEFSCYSSLYVNVSGGTPPYNYEILTPLNIYTNIYEDNKVDFPNEGLNSFNTLIKITDNNNCIITSSIEIYGRNYIYSGSYCEIN
jgi:hypothetical protein